MLVGWVDGGRHRRNSGYGHASRCLMIALIDQGLEIVIIGPVPEWESEFVENSKIKKIPVTGDISSVDVVVQVSVPEGFKKFDVPTVFYTFLDVSGFTSKQEKVINKDSVFLAPNTTMLEYYKRKKLDSILFQPSIDYNNFSPNYDRRKEGSKSLSFFFVGTHSFRKGTDLLLEAFTNCFQNLEAHLHIHIPNTNPDKIFNDIIDISIRNKCPYDIKISSSYVSSQWLSRFYSRHDFFITCTRGEGWGIPVMEAMACGLPIISPNQNGLKDFSNKETLFEISGHNNFTKDISSNFGLNFKEKYSGENILSYFEPNLSSITSMLKRSAEMSREEIKSLGEKNREHLISEHNKNRTIKQAETVADKIRKLLNK